jgi:hypothetical protein
MKKVWRTVSIVAATNLVFFWIAYVLFSASFRPITLWQFLGVAPSVPESPWQTFLAYALGILSGPVSWLVELKSTQAFLVGSLLNSAIWGAIFGLPIYGLTQRMHRRAV